jgi:1,4-alpha-glucan branching enzyme
MSFIRKGNQPKDDLVVVCNFTPVVRSNYRIGLPKKGKLTEIFNSDAAVFGGSGLSNTNKLTIEASPSDGREYSIELLLPPLSVTVFKIS